MAKKATKPEELTGTITTVYANSLVIDGKTLAISIDKKAMVYNKNPKEGDVIRVTYQNGFIQTYESIPSEQKNTDENNKNNKVSAKESDIKEVHMNIEKPTTMKTQVTEPQSDGLHMQTEDPKIKILKDLVIVRIAQGISGLTYESMGVYLSKSPEELQIEIDNVCKNSGLSFDDLKKLTENYLKLKKYKKILLMEKPNMKINMPEFEKRVKEGKIKKYIDPTGKYIGWNYTDKVQFEKSWDEYTLLARGIVTLSDGAVISRPFTKFFNLGEPEAEPIPWKDTIEVTEKIDGSLIILSFYQGNMILNSKGSFTSEHADFARNWLNENYPMWLMRYKENNNNLTFLFEAVFPETDKYVGKVINYGDRADLTLLAIINTETGEEFTHEKLKNFANLLKFPLVPRYDFEDIQSIINQCKSRKIEEGEGLVLHFLESGKRVKVKSDEYIHLHRLISHTSPKHVLESIMRGDDIESIYSSLPDELYSEVKTWMNTFQNEYDRIYALAQKTQADLNEIPSRKWKSLHIIEHPELNEIRSVLYAMMDNETNLSKFIWATVKRKFDTKENPLM